MAHPPQGTIMNVRCTRCFGVLDRFERSIVEEFSDGAWCWRCFRKWLRYEPFASEIPDDAPTQDQHDRKGAA